ncbi:FAD-dependent oxidoreductase, partial [Escherichia coli]|nr:FAD-dependent oxidoreductase [Escherichia coli]
TGSQPRQLPGVTIDNQQILDNRGALALTAVPPRLGVIGAGVIGLELGSVWNRVGSDVTLLKMAPTFLPALEARLSNEVRKAMIASGMKMQLAVEIEAIEQRDDGVHVRWRQGEKREESRFDKLILAIGRV